METKNSVLFINSGSLPMPPVSGGAIQQVLYNIADGLALRNWSVGVMTTTNPLSKSAQNRNITWYEINEKVGSGSIKDIFSSIMNIKKNLRRIPLDKFENVIIFDPYLAPVVRSWNKNVKIFWSVHNTRNKTAPLIKYWTRDVDTVISVSEFLKESVDQLITQKKSYFIYNPLPNQWFDSPVSKQKKKGSILYCGRLVPEKGVHILIEAISNFPEEIKKDITLGIAGASHFSGSKETSYSKNILELLKNSGVKYEILGYVNNKDLPDVYDEYEVLAVPSNWDEPATLVAGEGQSRNCIVVATDAGGLPELVAPQWRKLIAKKGDAESLKNSLLKAIELSKSKEKIDVTDWLKENLSNDSRVDKWIEIFLLNSQHRNVI